MKITKTLAALAVMALGSAAFAEVTFYNKVTSDVYDITKVKIGDNKEEVTKEFPGIRERADVEFKSEKFDAEVQVTTWFKEIKEGGNPSATNPEVMEGQATYWGVEDWSFDGYIEYRPFSWLTLGFHDNIWTPGSYLPVADDNMSAGNLGSSGFTLCFRPVAGLRVSASVPFPGPLGTDKDVNDKKYGDEFPLVAGVDYTTDIFGIGATVQDMFDSDERGFGIYGMLNLGALVDNEAANVKFTLGYTSYKADKKYSFNDVAGDDLVNFGADWSYKKVGVLFDFVTNVDKNGAGNWDRYCAAQESFGFSEAVVLGCKEALWMDDDDNGYENAFEIKPFVDIIVGNHTFEVAADLTFGENYKHFCFPVMWKYAIGAK